MFYPNQRNCVIHRDVVKKNNNRVYVCLYNENVLNACKVLSGSAFKVWMYLVSNKNYYSLEYSPAAIANATNLAQETVRRNFKELEEKKFIIPAEGSKTQYDFYEVNKPNIKIKIDKRCFTDTETGEIYYMSYSELVNAIGEYDARAMWEVAKDEPTTDK